MDNHNIITSSSKHYEYIIREIMKHYAFFQGKKGNTAELL